MAEATGGLLCPAAMWTSRKGGRPWVALEPAVWPALALADLPLLAGRALEEMGPGPLMGLLAGPGPPGLPSRCVWAPSGPAPPPSHRQFVRTVPGDCS